MNPGRSKGFTLLELIVVVLIGSLLAIYAMSRIDDKATYQTDSIAQQVISSINLTQQLAMNDAGRSFLLLINSSSIDLQADGSSMNINGYNFPLNFDSDVTLSPTTSLSFNSLGETSAITLTLNAGAVQQICVESSGYARLC